VLLGQCYSLPDNVLCPSGVRSIVDCGANIGITSLFFASRYPNATIYSIEPHPENFALLQQNVRTEKRIVPINAAVVSASSEVVRFSTDRPSWGNMINGKGGGTEVPAITISQILTRFGLAGLDLLKVDIEGAEREIFENGEFLPHVGLGIIELHDGYTFEKFASDVAKWGGVALRAGSPHGCKMITFQGGLVAALRRSETITRCH
jgi:FkbM family methyltransferase